MSRFDKYYVIDKHGNQLLNGCFFATDPAICDYKYFGIQSDYFTKEKALTEDSNLIPIDPAETFREAIEAAEEDHVSLFVMVYEKGKVLHELLVYECE